MNRFISFETQSISANTGGEIEVPIYKGPLAENASTEVRIDGTITGFVDQSVVTSLRNAIVTMWPSRFSRKRRSFDCNDFVCMMLGKETGKDKPFEMTHEWVDPDDMSITDPVILAVKLRNIEPIPVHTLYPAHTKTSAMYMHKLGDKGPLCISSLDTAKEILGARVARLGKLS